MSVITIRKHVIQSAAKNLLGFTETSIDSSLRSEWQKWGGKMLKIGVTSTNLDLLPKAQQLAEQLLLPITSIDNNHFDYLLVYTPEHLEIRQTQTTSATGPIFIDFLAGKLAHRRLYGGGRNQPLARAIGLQKYKSPTVIDATAGFGQDGFVLACLGCQMTLIERSPVIAALLQDALERVKQVEPDFPMQVIKANAIDYLQHCEKPDVIYCDPMFPERTKSALVKKEMRLARELVGEDEDSPQLLQQALQTANKRVVVKRPIHADPITGIKPSTEICGKKYRYDVYISH